MQSNEPYAPFRDTKNQQPHLDNGCYAKTNFQYKDDLEMLFGTDTSKAPRDIAYSLIEKTIVILIPRFTHKPLI